MEFRGLSQGSGGSKKLDRDLLSSRNVVLILMLSSKNTVFPHSMGGSKIINPSLR